MVNWIVTLNLFRCTTSASAPHSGMICPATGKLACNLCEGKSQIMTVRNYEVSQGVYAQYHVLHVKVSLVSDLHTAGGMCTTA